MKPNKSKSTCIYGSHFEGQAFHPAALSIGAWNSIPRLPGYMSPSYTGDSERISRAVCSLEVLEEGCKQVACLKLP